MREVRAFLATKSDREVVDLWVESQKQAEEDRRAAEATAWALEHGWAPPGTEAGSEVTPASGDSRETSA